jgi:hypothetical protein
MSERFPFMTDSSERPQLAPAQRREAVAVFLGVSKYLLFTFEGAEERNEVSDDPNATTLHLHNQQDGELIVVDAEQNPGGEKQGTAIELLGLADNAVAERHYYARHDEDVVVREDIDVSGTQGTTMWVPPGEVEAMHGHLMQKVEGGLYVPVNTVHALRLQGVYL